MKSIRTLPTLYTAFASALFLTSQVYGQAIANFSEGVGTDNPTAQFVGTTGEGWVSPWATYTENTTMSTDVLNTNPMFETGNYLQVELQGGASANRRSALNRTFENQLALGAHTISFSIRADDLTGLNSTGDFFGIFATQNAVTGSASSAAQTWGILINGGNSRITFRDGDESPNTVDTGIVFAAGVTYSFVLDVNPQNFTWQGSLSTSDNESFTSGIMDFRNDTPTTHGGRTININTLMSSEADAWTYSMDGITVIPEPSTAALFILGSCLVLVPCLSKFHKKQ